MTDHTPSRPAMALRKARERKRLSRAALAERIDTAERVIAALERGEQRLSEVWISRLAPALGAHPADFFADNPLADQVAVIGEVRAGSYVEALEWDEDQRFMVAAPLSERSRRALPFGLVVRGDSMDLLYPDGSIVLVAKIERLGEVPQPDKVYLVERDVDGRREYTLKRLQSSGGALWLAPQSSNLAHQPWRLDADDSIRIRARVVGAIIGE